MFSRDGGSAVLLDVRNRVVVGPIQGGIVHRDFNRLISSGRPNRYGGVDRPIELLF